MPMKKTNSLKKFGLVASTAILTVIFFVSPAAEKVSTFGMLETISIIDNLMIPINSNLLAETQPIQGIKIQQDLLKSPVNTPHQRTTPELEQWIKKSQTRVLVIWKQGEIVHESYSDASEQGLGINGLSMAKTITALLIGVAIDEGLIQSEEESILTYLPEVILEEGDQVSIKNLLQQESGMHDFFPHVYATLQGESLKNQLSELEFKTDKKFQYSNVNYHLLSLILQRVYKKEFNEIISEKLWLPLNLENAKVINSTGYCCIFASARSWLAIGQLFLNEGVFENRQIVSKAWLDKLRYDKVEPESFVVQLSSKAKNNTYAYHIFSGIEDAPELYWSEGMGLQLMLIDPVKKIIVIRLGDVPTAFKSNTNRWDTSLGEDLLTFIKSL